MTDHSSGGKDVPRLKTQRLALREFESSDNQVLFELYRLPETSRFETWTPHETIDETRELLEHWIARQADVPRIDFTFAIDLGDTFIGLCGLQLGFGTETDDLRTGFVGYRLHPVHWNHGYATEALLAMVAFGFAELGLHRIHSGCAASNAASIRVLEKAGFSQEGRSRKSFPIGSDWHDYVLFGRLRADG